MTDAPKHVYKPRMLLRELTACMEALAPLHFAESWDNVGLLLGDPEQPVRHVLFTIDYTAAVAQEARALGCDAVVSYHPPWFVAMKRLTAPHPLFAAARDGIAIFSPHTALDVAPGGTNDVLADAVGLVTRRPLRFAQTEPASHGIGRIGELESKQPLGEIVERVKRQMGLAHALVAGEATSSIRTVAVCAGAGGELLGEAIAQKADLFVTGEMRHHDALRALSRGTRVVCLLHSCSERAALRPLMERLREKLPALKLTQSSADADPFSWN